MYRLNMKAIKQYIFLFTMVSLFTPSHMVFAQSTFPDMPTVLERMIESHYLPTVTVGLGSFTYADTQLPTPFSRWVEDELRLALSHTPKMKLFDKQLAAAMDPSILKLYKEFFGTDRADSILYGKYSLEDMQVRIQLSLTDLGTGSLISQVRYMVPLAVIPRDIEIQPSVKTMQDATALSLLGGNEGLSQDFLLSIATDRGIGAVYRDQEYLTLFITSNKDAYLKLYHVDVNGKAQLIWPNRFGGSGHIQAGQAMLFPGPGDGFKYRLGKPYGTEYIKAIASTVPFTSQEADFTDLAGSATTAITRGLSVISTTSSVRTEALVVYQIVP